MGPPGVSQTSFARSIARALWIRFAHVSLGVVSDEAEIRGHRRTYIGSMPGSASSKPLPMQKQKTPFFFWMKSIKWAPNFRGDPLLALLKAIKRNKTRLSTIITLISPLICQSVFVATAITRFTIRLSLSRMELIELSGYTEEKYRLQKKYLIPRQREEMG